MPLPPEISNLFERQVHVWLALGLDRRLGANRREFRAWYIDPLREQLRRFESKEITATELPFLLVFPERFGTFGRLCDGHGRRFNLASLRDTTQPHCLHRPYLATEVRFLVIRGTEIFDNFRPVRPTAAEIVAASLMRSEGEYFVLHGSRLDDGSGFETAPLLTRHGCEFYLEPGFYPEVTPADFTYTAVTLSGRLY